MFSVTKLTHCCAFLGFGLGAIASTVAAASSDGCSLATAVEVGNTTNVTIDNRWYLLYFPVNYNPATPAPLILSYHGGNRNASEQQKLDMLSTTYFNEDYVIVYPNGINVSQNLSLQSLQVTFMVCTCA